MGRGRGGWKDPHLNLPPKWGKRPEEDGGTGAEGMGSRPVSGTGQAFRRYDGWVEGEGEGRTPISIFPPDGGRGPKRMGEQERRGWVPASAGRTIGGPPQQVLRRGRGEEGGFQTHPYGGTEGRERKGNHPHPVSSTGRLFAGTTVGGPPLRWDGAEGEGGESPSPRNPSCMFR